MSIQSTSHSSSAEGASSKADSSNQKPKVELSSHRSGTFPAKQARRSSQSSKRRAAPAKNVVRTVDRIREPIIVCFRCGQRFLSSWTKDTTCPKCGRRPSKILLWDAALCLFFPPASLVSTVLHRRDSPRRAAAVLLLGLAGAAIYFVLLRR